MSKVTDPHRLNYYLDLKYPILVHEEEEGGYVAEIPDLPGCLTQAETINELMEMVKDAKRAWIEVALEEGQEIPLPRAETQFSGKFLVRAPINLHRRLAQAAADERISLNQYVVQLLSGRVDLDLVLRRIDSIDRNVASVQWSLNYTHNKISTRSFSLRNESSPVTIVAGGNRKIEQAVAS